MADPAEGRWRLFSNFYLIPSVGVSTGSGRRNITSRNWYVVAVGKIPGYGT